MALGAGHPGGVFTAGVKVPLTQPEVRDSLHPRGEEAECE